MRILKKKMNHTPIPDKKFKEILNLMTICTADLIFLNKNRTKILLFKRKNKPLKGIYFAIGGRLLKNEKIIDGAVRQAIREAGLRIKKNKLRFEGIEEKIHKNSAFRNISYHTVVFYYSYILDEARIKLRLDNQHNNYRWFPINDRKIHPLLKTRIKKIIKNHGKKF